MPEIRTYQPDNEQRPTLPDVSRLPLDRILDSDDSALGNAVRRLLREMDRPGESYAAHGTTP